MFLEIALLLAISGSTYQAMDPPGMKESLDALQNLPAGWLILMVMALGLIAFSVYSFSEAFWRRSTWMCREYRARIDEKRKSHGHREHYSHQGHDLGGLSTRSIDRTSR